MRPGSAGEAGASPTPAQVLAQLLMANRVQQAIYAATRLGIADLLGSGPKSSEELALAAGCHPGALYRLLRALAANGLFTEIEPRCFSLNPLASLLRTGVPGSMRPVALWSGSVAYRVFGELEYSVRTGEPAFDHLFGMEFFEYLAGHPEMGTLFDEFMARQTAAVAGTLPTAYDFSGIGTLVDVGGGRGELLATILRHYPALRGLLFDRPQVIAGARGILEAAGVADRCATLGGDLSNFIPPGGDAYLLKSIVHGADDETAAGWLKGCRRAMGDSGKLLLVEFVIPPGNTPHPGKLMDVLMLAGTHGGRERTESEFRGLLEAAGFRLTRVVATESFYSVIEGKPIHGNRP